MHLQFSSTSTTPDTESDYSRALTGWQLFVPKYKAISLPKTYSVISVFFTASPCVNSPGDSEVETVLQLHSLQWRQLDPVYMELCTSYVSDYGLVPRPYLLHILLPFHWFSVWEWDYHQLLKQLQPLTPVLDCLCTCCLQTSAPVVPGHSIQVYNFTKTGWPLLKAEKMVCNLSNSHYFTISNRNIGTLYTKI